MPPIERSAALARAALALALGMGTAMPSFAATPSCRVSSPDVTVAVVELYTSQGCSSCPPADRWLSGLPAGGPHFQAIPLALHIGYWDYIGWKDPFARREFNERQYQLAAFNGSRGVYTPEVFVGGAELRDWSGSHSFADALAAVNGRAPRARIALQAQWLDDARGDGATAAARLQVQADWSADHSSRDPQLLLAVKRSGYLTDVQAGENRGSSLRNDHVVRAWSGPFKPAGANPAAGVESTLRTELAIPRAPGDATLVAIAQDGVSGAILQAVELPLDACGAAR
jgi:hypothetical protein